MRLSTQSLARASSRHPGRTIGLWILGIIVSGVLIGSLMGSATTTEADFTNTPEAKEAEHLLEQRLRGPQRDTEIYVVSSDRQTVDSPGFRAYVERLKARVEGLGPKVVQGVQSFYDTDDASLVSQDRRTTILPTLLTADIQDAVDDAPELRQVIDETREPGFRTQLFGTAALNEDLNRVAEEDLRSGESIGLMAALIILVVVFGAVVAALLPVGIAIASITMAIAVVSVVGQITQFSFFVTNMISMMGLAVGIDYSLFIVSRYREERHRGLDKLDAIETAGATASRAVLFSGLTVVLALLGMILIPNTIFRSLASGAIFVVLIAVFASLTLLPALIGKLGDRINRLAIRRKAAQVEPGRAGGFWDRVTRGVMHRPVMSLVVGVAVLLAAAWSWTDMRTGFSGVSTLPDSFESKQAFEALNRDFPAGLSTPAEIVVDGRISDPAVQSGIQRLRDDLSRDPFFGPAHLEVNDAGDLALISVPMKGDPSSKDATNSISRIRSQYVDAAFPEGAPAEVLVGGVTAFNKDFFDLARSYMPIVFVFVLGLSFILLTLAFRSIVVPIKAIILNLLSVSAAYGLIVLVSQKGVGAGILGFQQVDTIEAWLPLFLFSVLFGLSMDYHVFLLSRIREHYDQTHDNTESVAYGLRTTAGIITGAALIMVAVFGGFASGKLVMFQQMGFGLGVAVLIDATLIRTVLVPASMRLLGDRNWYLPRWLEWLPDLGVEGRRPESVAEPRPSAAGAEPDGQVPAKTRV